MIKAGLAIIIFGAVVIAILTAILIFWRPKVASNEQPAPFRGPTGAPYVKGPTAPPPGK